MLYVYKAVGMSKTLPKSSCPSLTCIQHLHTSFLAAEVWQGPRAAQRGQAKHTESRGGPTAQEWPTYYTEHYIPSTAAHHWTVTRSSIDQSRKQAQGKDCLGHSKNGWKHLLSEAGGGIRPSISGIQTHPCTATSLPIQRQQQDPSHRLGSHHT